MLKKKISILLSIALSTSIMLSPVVTFAAAPQTQVVATSQVTSNYTQKDLNEQDVMALLWMQTSAEYRELCYQAYNAGKMQVDAALKNHKSGDKPLAIITDCDESVIDNTAYDAGHTGHNTAYASDSWAKWVDAAKADAMPGSKEFLQYLSSKGVDVFYVTNRDAKHGMQGTMKNLKDLGFPNADEKHLLLQTDKGNKQGRFDAVAKDYNVVFYMGDNENDLPIGTYGVSLDQRNAAADKNKDSFGTKFIALPNPSYGDFESAVASGYWGLSAAKKDEARKAPFKTWRADGAPAIKSASDSKTTQAPAAPITTTTTTQDTYTVKPGDNLFRIGLKFSMDFKALAKINNISNVNLIYVGQTIKLLPKTVQTTTQPQTTPAPYSQKDLNEQNVMAILWMQTAAEYRELCYQAYNLTKMQVDEALKNHKSGDKPLAIITDCDESVIDNSAYEAGHTGYNSAYSSDSWGKWVDAAKADAMPGAKDMLQYLSSKGVHVFYVTNRDAKKGLQGTMKNLKDLGFPNVDEKHVLLQTDKGNKQARFDAVAKDYNVVAYMGDNENDLPIGTYGVSLQQRNATADKNKDSFGTKFIALPNPSYGDFEPAVASGYWGLSPQQKDAARKALLRTWRADGNN
ncbi:5'-nucleotidase, lipoprotein e(P4) family [Clostridium sp. P21]|uniref:5'-nucleotidase, lipoprotein e(P4) family n=1 Tax=Clostridium muellerianum TaxID=2716538 RepID=A0A7Y0EGB9_9CLOT|nr:5'-nucleotidase, lipoprotein e(P4) family [Clostridium muellerianum]NMM62974.1 5'-nucleotidase, lipoprotein e(P4) family [Clostridium muellerianum]